MHSTPQPPAPFAAPVGPDHGSRAIASGRVDRNRGTAGSRTAISLLEVIVVIVILAILMALILPAVQSSRESARRIQCQSHMRQLMLAVHNYEATHNYLPAGWGAHGYLYRLLPYVDAGPLFQAVSKSLRQGTFDRDASELLRGRPAVFVCPASSTPPSMQHVSNYAGNVGFGSRAFYAPVTGEPRRMGYNGIFTGLEAMEWNGRFGGPISSSAVTDGLSQTAGISEIVTEGSSHPLANVWHLHTQLGMLDQMDAAADACERGEGASVMAGMRGDHWLEGSEIATLYNHVATPNRRSCLVDGGCVPCMVSTAASQHPGGVNLAFADGRVLFISESIDRPLWRAVGTRDSGEPLQMEEF